GPAFFGLRGAEQSLTFTRAETLAAPFELALAGTVSVYEAFPVFGDTIRIQVGDKSVTLKPDSRGLAGTEDASIRVTNANAFGVIYGGRMEFAATLKGAGWLHEVERLGVGRSSSPGSVQELPVTIDIGRTRHTAIVPVNTGSPPPHDEAGKDR